MTRHAKDPQSLASRAFWFSLARMACFGGLFLTDNFHALNNLIYPWLGLGQESI